MAESNGAAPTPADAVRRLDGSEATELGALAAVFDDLQYTLRCCEHLVGVARPTRDATPCWSRRCGRVRWSAYARCFSGRTKVLTDDDLAELELDGDVAGFHRVLLQLRDHYASRHANPRETFTIGVAQTNNGTAAGVAVIGAPQPGVDDTTVRQLGRIAYGLSGLVDARMQAAQQRGAPRRSGARRRAARRVAAGGRAGAGLSYSGTRAGPAGTRTRRRRLTGRCGVRRGEGLHELAPQPAARDVVELATIATSGREVPR